MTKNSPREGKSRENQVKVPEKPTGSAITTNKKFEVRNTGMPTETKTMDVVVAINSENNSERIPKPQTRKASKDTTNATPTLKEIQCNVASNDTASATQDSWVTVVK